MKSTLVCLKCKKESTIFDVFTNIPLSLPEPSQLLLNVIVHRLPLKLKEVIDKKPQKKDAPPPSEDYTQQYTNLTNDQPIHICIKVDKNTFIRDVINKIMKVPEVNIDYDHHYNDSFSDLVLFS
mmetsp:Transcript_42310/g.64891  ORF Transcript_42310/g.64891 Transcript_42310/m.64891 type:complete len:124 (+) Transcript_42310:2737-3108(+)